MAFIAVKELRATGAELFQDTENYMSELNHLDDTIHGGQYAAGGTFSGGTATIYGLLTKGYEFGVYTVGIDAISHIVHSYSLTV